MIRDDLLDKLARYRPTSEEAENHARMIAFVRAHPACFERTHSAGHVTAAAWLVDDRSTDRYGPARATETARGTEPARGAGRVLLTHHRKLDKWLQLGGHCDGDGNVIRVALREAREESGIHGIELLSSEIFDLDVHPIPARGIEPPHFHYDVRFLCRITGDARFTLSEESHELRWVDGSELESMPVGKSIRRMWAKWEAASAK